MNKSESPSLLSANDSLAIAARSAIQSGEIDQLRGLLADHPHLATARIGDERGCGMSRTLLHVATDWPGHFPNGPLVVAALVEAGADVNARFSGPHSETPLHWAASSDDLAVLDALIDRGADLEAPGAVIGGGTPLADAVAFGQWNAARRLIERGAKTTLWQAAALGLVDRVRGHFESHPLEPWPLHGMDGDEQSAPPDEVTHAFWCACHGGQQATAELLLARGADVNWIGYDRLTPLDAARRSGADELVEWLMARGARSADDDRATA